ncbi:hypothetical protein DITRI_Ditri17bG0031400 [Diplodiscus trichospermus]
MNVMKSLHFLFLVFFFSLLCLSNSGLPPPCNGSIGECNEANEMLMVSEISRRFLEQKKYISPGALKRDEPVCNGGSGGEAYSKTEGCLPQPSNPYSRGCSKYYRCRFIFLFCLPVVIADMVFFPDQDAKQETRKRTDSISLGKAKYWIADWLSHRTLTQNNAMWFYE